MIGKYSGLQSSSYMFDWLSSKYHQNMTNQVYIHLQKQSNERLTTRLNAYFSSSSLEISKHYVIYWVAIYPAFEQLGYVTL